MARDAHYERAKSLAYSLPPSDFGSHRALEVIAAEFRKDAAELSALRAVAEAARHVRDAFVEPADGNPNKLVSTWRHEMLVKMQMLHDALAALDRVREGGGG